MCPYPLYRVPREEFQKTTCERENMTAVITEVQRNVFTASYILSDYIREVDAKTPLF